VDVSLGADALVKLLDADGEDMGQCYINFTDLLSPNAIGIPRTLQVQSLHPLLHISPYASNVNNPSLYPLQVPISSGGQYKGTLTGNFSLTCLHDQITLLS
jgi:hypothetical protein